MKACFAMVVVISVGFAPYMASAGFLSDIKDKVFGSDAPADTPAAIHNSQTMPLLESALDPDMNTVEEVSPVAIIGDEALAPNTSPLATSFDLEKNASSAKITVYTVKKGDTIKSIARKFKVSEDTIIYGNADIKKADITKVGQTLVILPTKAIADKIDKVEKVDSEKKDKAPVKKEEKKKVVLEDTTVEDTIPVVAPAPKVEEVPVVAPTPVATPTPAPISAPAPTATPEPATPAGQPTGTITGGYIWPFPAGAGRVSQGLHADQAYDFAAPIGTPIYAVQSGTILIAHPTGYNGGYGKYVVMNFNDGRQAIFGHMSKVVAEQGAIVKQGDIIGYVGSTGKSTGPHVHIGFHGPLGNPYLGLKVNSTDLQTNE